MAEPYLAEIKMFGGNFAPRGYSLCNGQLLAISQNTALFALLGTTYGGNGTSNYALPDMQGRAPVHQGNGTGVDPVSLGEVSGTPTVTLTTSQLPSHTHPISGATIANSNPGETPASNTLFTNSAPNQVYAAALNPGGINLATQSITLTGGSQPHNNMQPYLAVTFIIALQGVFPVRN
jgi:microcystin-dependent protein